MKDPLDELTDIHNLERWHNCPDGYRWRVFQEGTEYVGILLGPGGGQLARFEHPARSRVEAQVLKTLKTHRAA